MGQPLECRKCSDRAVSDHKPFKVGSQLLGVVIMSPHSWPLLPKLHPTLGVFETRRVESARDRYSPHAFQSNDDDDDDVKRSWLPPVKFFSPCSVFLSFCFPPGLM